MVKVGWAMKNEELRVCPREIMLLASWAWWRLFGRSFLSSVEVKPSDDLGRKALPSLNMGFSIAMLNWGSGYAVFPDFYQC